MVVVVITGRGPIRQIRVPSAVKINAKFYVDYVLKPLFQAHLPSLYRDEMHKVFFHHDKAPANTASETINYLASLRIQMGISYLENSEIPVKSPDTSPLDFFGFGYLKQQISSRRARRRDGVWKIAKQLWLEIDQDMVNKVFNSWKLRLRMVAANDGQHVENTEDIHSRSV